MMTMMTLKSTQIIQIKNENEFRVRPIWNVFDFIALTTSKKKWKLKQTSNEGKTMLKSNKFV